MKIQRDTKFCLFPDFHQQRIPQFRFRQDVQDDQPFDRGGDRRGPGGRQGRRRQSCRSCQRSIQVFIYCFFSIVFIVCSPNRFYCQNL